MNTEKKRVLVINTGSTSTKIAQFVGDERIDQRNLVIPMSRLQGKTRAVEQMADRTQDVLDYLADQGKTIHDFDIISARGGPMPPCEGGAYYVNDLMIKVLEYAPLSQHESALSCMIGYELTKGTTIPTIVYDGINSDEFKPEAQYGGVPGIRFLSRGHILNTRQVGHMLAEKMGKKYSECRFIIAHFGGSISVSSHEGGRITDMYNGFTGPMSPQRAGLVPTIDLVDLCFSGKYKSAAEVHELLNKQSGLMAYLGTQDGREVMGMVEAGDEKAILAVDRMAYQCAKCIGALAAGMNGQVDRIVYTGGLARANPFVDRITERVKFIAPIEILPGEFEMEALAAGAQRVLSGEEPAKEYTALPAGYTTAEEFWAYVQQIENSEVSRMITNFKELEQYVKSNTFRARCAVVEAGDPHVLEAVIHACKMGVVQPILVGNYAKIAGILRSEGEQAADYEIIDVTEGGTASAQAAIDLINQGKADYIMKGLINTALLMKVVFKEENNLRTGRIATSISIRKIPAYHKMLAFTDAGICISPSLEDKEKILLNGLDLLWKLGIAAPKVAVLAAVEQVNEKMPETVDAAELKRLAEAGEFGSCVVEGPISFDLAFSKEAAQIKGYKSPVAGDADMLLFPNVASGNMTTKAIDHTTDSTGGGIIVGAKVPLVFSSRSATPEYKYNSILLASAYCLSDKT